MIASTWNDEFELPDGSKSRGNYKCLKQWNYLVAQKSW